MEMFSRLSILSLQWQNQVMFIFTVCPYCVLFNCLLVITLVVHSCQSSVCYHHINCMLRVLLNTNEPACTTLLNCVYVYTVINPLELTQPGSWIEVSFLWFRSLNIACCRVIIAGCSKGQFMLNTMKCLQFWY